MTLEFARVGTTGKSPTLALLLLCMASGEQGIAAEGGQIEMTPERWQADGEVSFLKSERYPHGVMRITGTGAILKNANFGNGTIEYDINEDGDEQETSGIWFRRRNAQVAENFYLRLFMDCASTAECVQYAPVSRGNVQWDAGATSSGSTTSRASLFQATLPPRLGSIHAGQRRRFPVVAFNPGRTRRSIVT